MTGAFDDLVDDLDRFQKWKASNARKAPPTPQTGQTSVSAPGRLGQAQSFGKAMDTMAAELVELRRQTARQVARLRAQNVDAARQRGFATLDAVMSKAMAGVAEGRLTAVEAITIDRRCAAIAERLHAEDRAAKAARSGR